MRIKEIDRTANVAWSPIDHHPIYLATGTAAQQIDATFSTSSSLDLYTLNLDEATLEMPVACTKNTTSRFHKVLWGSLGSSDTDCPSGVIVTGADNGDIHVYNAASLLKDNQSAPMIEQSRHTGAVRALDLNPFQKNLLASGGGDSEIYIWDLNKPDSPMTPGQKAQPPEDVHCVAWNRQVQHILGSTFTAKCIVWDLRKNEPIIKVSESMSRIKCKQVAWHPEVATQLMLSSEDDHTPVIQLWDLRYATSPLKTLESHQRGVLCMSWCPQDPDLLLSCGKDNRILCWNPNSNIQGGEVIYEIPTSNQWCFDVQWCPRNPALISGATFDGHITIYSLMGGGHPIQPSNKIAESFNTMESFNQSPIPIPQQEEKIMPLQKPPKWLRKPAGASFAFGGKLVSFCQTKPSNPNQPVAKEVYISQVVTETELLQRSNQLEQATVNNQFVEFCQMKTSNTKNEMDESIWNFIRVNFEKNPKTEILHLLGYDDTDLIAKVAKKFGGSESSNNENETDVSDLTNDMSQLGQETNDTSDDFPVGFGAPPEGLVQPRSTVQSANKKPLVLSEENGEDGLMILSLLTGNFSAAVDICLSQNKMAEAIILAIAGGPELLNKTQQIYFQKTKSHLGTLISSIISKDWKYIVENCDLDNWREALAIILTYSQPQEYIELCNVLANRLEMEKNGELCMYAMLCYICAGNVEGLVKNWFITTDNSTHPLAIQDLIEKMVMLQKAVEVSQGVRVNINTESVCNILSQYASILASQGSLYTALVYINQRTEPDLAVLFERLYQAMGQQVGGIAVPRSPFQNVNIMASGVHPRPQQQQQNKQQQQQQQRGVKPIQQRDNKFNYPTNMPTSNPMSYNPTVPQNPVYQPTAPQKPFIPEPESYSNEQRSNKGVLGNKYPRPVPSYNDYSRPSSMPHDTQTYNPALYTQNQQNYNNYPMSTNPVGGQPTNYYTPTSSTPGGPYQDQYNQYNTSTVPSYQDVKTENAWNDPPLVKEKPTSKAEPVIPTQQFTNFTPQQDYYSDQGPPGAPNYNAIYNPQEHKVQPPAPKPEPPKPVVKVIPQEHQVLKDTLDKLVHKCSQSALNAQMKRKLDDVNKKLDVLYDRLSQSQLSSTVLQGLHQIIQYIQQYDYNTCLAIHTQMVSQGNFSEISAFMPGVKVLLQMSMQLQIFI